MRTDRKIQCQWQFFSNSSMEEESGLTAAQRARATSNKEAALKKRAAATAAAAKIKATSPSKEKPQNDTLKNFFQPKKKKPKTAASAPASTPEAFLAPLADAGWRAALAGEAKKSYVASLAGFVARERSAKTVFPPAASTFAALDACPLARIKVVVVGQDPYHGAGQAHGLAFSIASGSRGKYPPSLRNLLKEAKDDVGATMPPPGTGDLTAWARRGVLLLNACLTVRKGEANSHAKRGWESFTDAVIAAVNDRPGRGVVFLLWGKPAAAKCGRIDATKHRVLASSHPSPLSNTKTDTPFTGSKCFSRANALLTGDLGWDEGVDWNL
jgi:uracil-DNA glycosylase